MGLDCNSTAKHDPCKLSRADNVTLAHNMTTIIGYKIVEYFTLILGVFCVLQAQDYSLWWCVGAAISFYVFRECVAARTILEYKMQKENE